MHVPETGNEELARRINFSGARRHGYLRGISHGGNVIAADDDGDIGPRRATGDVNQGQMSQNNRLWLMIAPVSGQKQERQKNWKEGDEFSQIGSSLPASIVRSCVSLARKWYRLPRGGTRSIASSLRLPEIRRLGRVSGLNSLRMKQPI